MATYKGNNPLSQAIKDDARGVATALRNVMLKAAKIVANETRMNFKREGFMDGNLKKWKPRKKRDKGRAILTKTGTLSKSVRVTKYSAKRATIASVGKAAVYAGVHNYGLRAGRGKGFPMPKRQFLGESKTTDKRIVNMLKKQIKKGFR